MGARSSTKIRRTEKRCRRLKPEDQAKAKTLEANLLAETTKPPPRYTEATLLSAMETAGKLVDDEELADAMKERGLGTPATRADIIDGLIYQKYMDRNQRELVPSAKAEQLIQFLQAVKASDLTSPAMTGEWEHQLREMTRGKFSREKFMAGIVEETKGIVERVKNFEEDDSIARETEIISPTDKKPLRETSARLQIPGWRVHALQGDRRPAHGGVRDSRAGRERRNRSARRIHLGETRASFAAKLKLAVDRKTRRRNAETDFGNKVDFGTVEPFWKDPTTGAASCARSPTSYILREREGDAWKQTFSMGRLMCKKEIPREQVITTLEEGRTDVIKGFTSKKGRPFDAFFEREGPKAAWKFPPPPEEGTQGRRQGPRTAQAAGPLRRHRAR